MAARGRQQPDTNPSKRICYHCVYLMQPEPLVSYRDILPSRVIFPLCAHHADNPGAVREVHPAETCRHFRARRGPAERPNPVQPRDSDFRYIPLTKRQVAIVDAADYEWLSQYRWFAKGGSDGKYYAGRTEKGRSIMMHREIMNPPPGMVVDHINSNSLDNRRANMRICTPQQNHRNRRFTGNTSGFMGVYPHGKRWKAQITYEGERIVIGVFDDKLEAAQARDRKARELSGPFACLNFPDEQHDPKATHQGKQRGKDKPCPQSS